MRLLRVEVESFGCIERASVELGPGLNILYGPNDLGKSSLVHAIRCGLLMQHTSSDIDEFRPWRGGGRPRISIVYQTEPQRIWRLTKVFDGGHGSSLLEHSRDGQDFAQECVGRKVDEVVRQHLAWGISAPGKGAQRGLPRSFLATAFLADQREVDEILALSLKKYDDDDSGRRKISAALQAVAQDPLFQSIFKEVQARVDAAFTETGRLKAGKTAEITRFKAAVVEAQAEVSEWRSRVEASRAVKTKLAEDHARRDRKLEELREGQDALAELRRRLADQRVHEEKAAAVARARGDLGRADEARGVVAAAEARLLVIGETLGTAEGRVEELARAGDAAALALEGAREALRAEQSDAAAQRLATLRSELERRELEAEHGIREAQAALEGARVVEGREVAAAAAERAVAELARAEAALAGPLAAAAGRLEQLDGQLAELGGILLLRAFEEARRDEAEAQSAAQAAAGLEADQARAAAEEERLARSTRPTPPAGELERLRRLERAAQVAEEALALGVALELRPARPLAVSVTSDGAATPPRDVVGPATFEARREIRLVIDGVGEILVSGGAREDRERASAKRRELEAQARPILQAAGVADLDALAGAIASADENKRLLQALASQRQDLAARRLALGDVNAKLAGRREAARDAEQRLAGRDRAALERLAAARAGEKARDLQQRQTTAEAHRRQAEAELRKLELEQGALRSRHEAALEQLARATAELGEAAARLPRPWRTIAAEAGARDLASRGELRAAQAELEHLRQGATSSVEAARARVAAAEEAVARARLALAEGTARRDALRQEHAKLGGQLEIHRAAARAFDRAALADALRRAEEELAATPAPARPVLPEDVAAAEQRLATLGAERRDLDREIHLTEGTLTSVDGAVAEERLLDAEAAFDTARRRQGEKEQELQAWRLLRETLLEAQREESVHLGRLLAEPLAEQLKALTGARYQGVTVSTELETEGVIAGGASRAWGQLSVGTREQLATLFRLALARQVGSLVVLDDQLVQSDRQRMAWFSTLLREVGQMIQVVVFTCREADYVDPDHPVDAPRAIDLRAHVTRAG